MSRFCSRSGVYLYDKLRRTDFLPVGDEKPDEVLERGYDSESSDDENGKGLEYAFAEDTADEDEDEEQSGRMGVVSADFM